MGRNFKSNAKAEERAGHKTILIRTYLKLLDMILPLQSCIGRRKTVASGNFKLFSEGALSVESNVSWCSHLIQLMVLQSLMTRPENSNENNMKYIFISEYLLFD